MDQNFKTILCYGDSNTYGYNPKDGMRYTEDVRWPSVLRSLLGDGYRVIEEGCNGRTAACAPADETWKDGRTYLKACLNSHKPLDAVVLMLGSNDLKKQFGLTPEIISESISWMLHTIADFLKEKQGFVPWILLVSPPEIGDGITSSPFSDSFAADAVPRSKAFAPLYEQAAAEYADSTSNPCGFLDAARIIRPSEIDSLHLMPEAHHTLAEAVADLLRSRF